MNHDETHEGTATDIERDHAAWPNLLADEETRCREQGFGAGVIAVNLSVNTGARGRVIDTRDLADLDNRTRAALDRCVGWTDRLCHLADHEYGLLVIPVEDSGALRERAVEVDTALREAGIGARVGFSLRNDHTGLAGAAARADAAAAAPRKRPVRTRRD